MVSVKTRFFRKGSKESLDFVIDEAGLVKLEHFGKRFNMQPFFAQVFCQTDRNLIQVVILPVDSIGLKLDKVKNGYALRFRGGTGTRRLIRVHGHLPRTRL